MKLGGWSYNYPDNGKCRDSIVVSIDKNIKLLAVRLFGSEHNKYSVTLQVTDSNGVVLATKKGNFVSELIQSEAGDYQGFEIVFEPPVALQASIQYCFDAFICGQPSWNGRGGLSRVQHPEVTFSFANKAGVVEGKYTTVSEGQFPEFIFAVD